MADNTVLNAGTGGDTLATDDISGVKYPRSKITLGADGTNDGDVCETNPMPVGGNTVKDGSGTLYALLVDSDGNLQVDIVGALPAGTNAIGKLAANSGVDIGDVDVTTVITGTGATNLGKANDSAAGSTDTGVATLMVRDDSLGTLTPADGDYTYFRGNSRGAQWVVHDGTLTVDASGTTVPISAASLPLPTGASTLAEQETQTGHLSSIVTAVQALDNAVSGNEFQVDVVSQVPGTGATNLGKAVDSAAGSTDTGVAALVVRDDSLSTLTPADGDYTNLRVDSTGRIWCNVSNTVTVAGTGTFAAQITSIAAGDNNIGNVDIASIVSGTGATNLGKAEDEAHSSGDVGVFMLSVRKDTAATTAGSDGDYAALTTDSAGKLHVNVGNSSIAVTNTGTFAVQVTSLPAGTNNIGDVDVLSVIPGTSATNLGKAIDSAAGSTDTGVAALGIRDDSLTSLTPADGDYVPFRVDSTGRVWANVSNTVTVDGSGVTQPISAASLPLPTGASTLAEQETQTTHLAAIETAIEILDNAISGNEMQVDIVSHVPGTGATNLGKAEDAAHSSGDTGVFVLGVRADTPASTGASDGDYTGLTVDSSGRLWCNVNNTVTVAGTGTFAVQVSSALPSGTNNIGDVDVLSVVPGTSGTSLGKAVDSAAGSTDTGVAILAIRDDSLDTLTPAEGDYAPLRVSSTGALHVTGGGGGTQYAVDDALGSTPTGTLSLAIRDNALSTLSPAEGDAVGLRVDGNGALWTIPSGNTTVVGTGTFSVQVSSIAAGTNAIGKLAANSGVDIGDVDVTTVTPGTGAAHLGKAEDSAHSSGDVGVMLLGVRLDSGATLAGADGDYTPMQFDSSGALRVTGGGGGTQYVADDAAPSNPTGTTMMMQRDDALGGLSEAEGDWTNAYCDANGSLWTTVYNVTPGTGASNLGKAEDAVHASGDVGVMALSVRRDSASALSGTEGDYQPLITNADGALYVTGADGTQYDIGTALSSTAKGTVALAIRDDALSTLSDAEGDAVGLRVGETGALWTTVTGTVTVGSHAVTNAGTFAVQVDGSALTALQLIDDVIFVDDAAFTPGSSKVAMVGAQFDDNTPDSVNEGDAGALRMSANRNLYTVIRDAAGNERGLNIDASGYATVNVNGTVTVGSHAVTNAGTFAVQVDGAALTALQLIDDIVLTDDAAFTPATSKVAMVGAQYDDSGTDSVDEGDAGAIRMSANRNLYVRIRDNAGNERGLNIDANGALAAVVSGVAAHDAAVSGNPLLLAGEARSTEGTAVASGDVARLQTDLVGKLVTMPYAIPQLLVNGTNSATDTANTSLIASAGAGVRNYITQFTVFNDSATDTFVSLKDGTTTKYVVPAPAHGGACITFPAPLKGTAETAWNTAAGDSVTTLYCSASGFTGV